MAMVRMLGDERGDIMEPDMLIMIMIILIILYCSLEAAILSSFLGFVLVLVQSHRLVPDQQSLFHSRVLVYHEEALSLEL